MLVVLEVANATGDTAYECVGRRRGCMVQTRACVDRREEDFRLVRHFAKVANECTGRLDKSVIYSGNNHSVSILGMIENHGLVENQEDDEDSDNDEFGYVDEFGDEDAFADDPRTGNGKKAVLERMDLPGKRVLSRLAPA